MSSIIVNNHLSIAGFARGSRRILYFCNDPSAEIRRASELRSDAARIDAERDVRGKRQRLEVHVPEVAELGVAIRESITT